MGYDDATQVQSEAIPLIMEGKDILASSQTGTGKTGAFLIPLIAMIEEHKHKDILIVTPTRELAEQIKREIKKFSKNKHLEVMAVYGGVAINPQIHKLRDAEVVVGTPGRIGSSISKQDLICDGFICCTIQFMISSSVLSLKNPA